jgi:hypothetical protein
VFRGCFGPLCESLTGAAPGDAQLQFFPVKESAASVSVRMVAGEVSGFLKLFDGPRSEPLYKREKAALLALSGQDVIPEIISFSDELQFVLVEWHEADTDLGSDPEGFARRIGAWAARYDAVAPSRPLQGNWYTYGLKLGLGRALQDIPAAQAQLSAVPLCGEVLSHNDAALHNFVEGPGGHLLGCDFEHARFKPRGWDFIRGYWSLLERFPSKARPVLKAYQRGFDVSHRGVLQVQELSAVARVLFCAHAISSAGIKEEPTWQPNI